MCVCADVSSWERPLRARLQVSCILQSPPAEVVLVTSAADPIASAGPVKWATTRLETALAAKGATVRRAASISDAGANSAICIAVAGAASQLGMQAQRSAQTNVAREAEALGILPAKVDNRPVIAALGHDVRGAVWAVLELADRAENGITIAQALSVSTPTVERPANKIRAVSRLFTSDVEDKPWFNDREMWPKYLTMLASQRFNRFNLALRDRLRLSYAA